MLFPCCTAPTRRTQSCTDLMGSGHTGLCVLPALCHQRMGKGRAQGRLVIGHAGNMPGNCHVEEKASGMHVPVCFAMGGEEKLDVLKAQFAFELLLNASPVLKGGWAVQCTQPTLHPLCSQMCILLSLGIRAEEIGTRTATGAGTVTGRGCSQGAGCLLSLHFGHALSRGAMGAGSGMLPVPRSRGEGWGETPVPHSTTVPIWKRGRNTFNAPPVGPHEGPGGSACGPMAPCT